MEFQRTLAPKGSRRLINLQDILAARERIRGHVAVTPCPLSQPFSDLCGAQIHFKLENLQRTGSFKERGAANKLALLTQDERARGIVAASAGNHAQGVAVNAQRLGIKATIVMPETTPLIKAQATKSFGARVVFFGTSLADAFVEARRIEKEQGAVFIHAFDDDAIIAGQGTAGLEILEQVPDVEVVVGSIGGGGWLGGIAVAVKAMKPSVRVVGVESALVQKMRAALDAGAPVPVPAASTLADGIAVSQAGDRTLPLFTRYVDEIVCVDDEEVANAILLLIEKEKTVAEGAGAVPAAALLQHKVKGLRPEMKVVCVISGGNIDVNLLARIIERGLVKEGRRVMLSVRVPDRPGMLASILQAVAAERANVLEVHHNRAFLAGPVGDTEIDLTLETRGADHIESLIATLSARGFKVTRR
jgi:threonine dehydratase